MGAKVAAAKGQVAEADDNVKGCSEDVDKVVENGNKVKDAQDGFSDFSMGNMPKVNATLFLV